MATPPRQVRTLADAERWVEAGFDRAAGATPLSQAERLALARVARAAGRRAPRDAAWPLAVASLGPSGMRAAAFREAASRKAYSDGGEPRRRSLLRQLDPDGRFAWAPALAVRLSPPPRAYRIAARRFLVERRGDRERRVSVLRVGALLLRAAKTTEDAREAAAVVELAATPTAVLGGLSPRRALIGRTDLVASLRDGGRTGDADEAFRTFREKDAMLALPDPKDVDEDRDARLAGAATLALSPISLACVAAFSALGAIAVPRRGSGRPLPRFVMPVILAVAVVAGAALARMPLSGLAFVACAPFALTLEPVARRSTQAESHGPLFETVALVFAFLLAVGGVLLAAGLTPLGRVVLPLLPPAAPIRPEPVARLLLLLAGAMTAVPPLYAHAQRRGTGDVARAFLRKTLRYVFAVALVALVAALAAAVLLDAPLRRDTLRALENEPVYYLGR